MLDTLKVYDVPEWSIIFEVKKRDVYFKTRINPEIKSISMCDIDFSNNGSVLILNMDVEEGGDVLDRFHPYTNEEMREFTEQFVVPILPEEFFTGGGLTLDEYLERTSTQTDAAALSKNQHFKGVWRKEPENPDDELTITLWFDTRADAVSGRISFSEDAEEVYPLDHIHLIGNDLRFTFETDGLRNKFLEVQGILDDERMNITLCGIEDDFGSHLLLKQNEQ